MIKCIIDFVLSPIRDMQNKKMEKAEKENYYNADLINEQVNFSMDLAQFFDFKLDALPDWSMTNPIACGHGRRRGSVYKVVMNGRRITKFEYDELARNNGLKPEWGCFQDTYVPHEVDNFWHENGTMSGLQFLKMVKESRTSYVESHDSSWFGYWMFNKLSWVNDESRKKFLHG